MKTADEFVLILRQNHLITDVELGQSEETKSPWYIKTLMGLCGWLAALFVLGFIGAAVASIFDSPIGMTVVGALLIAGAYLLLVKSDSEFVEHLGLAISIAGQSLVAFALFSHGASDEAFTWLVLTVLHCILAFLMPNFIHRMLSAFFATFSLSFFMMALHLSSFYSAIVLLSVALLWLNEFSFSQHVRKLQAVGYGAVIGLVQFKTSMLFAGSGNTWMNDSLPGVNPWLDEGLNMIVMVFVIYQLVRQRKLIVETNQKWFYIALLILIGVGSLFANGIVCAILVLIIGFAIQNRALLVIGVFAALLNLSSYYYLLDMTLLNKSFTLAGLGGAGLLLAYVHKRFSKRGEMHVE